MIVILIAHFFYMHSSTTQIPIWHPSESVGLWRPCGRSRHSTVLTCLGGADGAIQVGFSVLVNWWVATASYLGCPNIAGKMYVILVVYPPSWGVWISGRGDEIVCIAPDLLFWVQFCAGVMFSHLPTSTLLQNASETWFVCSFKAAKQTTDLVIVGSKSIDIIQFMRQQFWIFEFGCTVPCVFLPNACGVFWRIWSCWIAKMWDNWETEAIRRFDSFNSLLQSP